MSNKKNSLNFPYWNLPIEELYQETDSTACGLTDIEAKRRLKLSSPKAKISNTWRLVFLLFRRQILDPLAIFFLISEKAKTLFLQPTSRL